MVVWTEEEAEEWAKENELFWKVNNVFNEVIKESRKSEREKNIKLIEEEILKLRKKLGKYNDEEDWAVLGKGDIHSTINFLEQLIEKIKAIKNE